MNGNRSLAFLFCDWATRGSNGKVNLHGVFDHIKVPAQPGAGTAAPTLPASEDNSFIFVFYKVAVAQPCTIELRILDPQKKPISGPWRDNISERGLVQTVWSVLRKSFPRPGTYEFQLLCDSKELAKAELVVELA